MRRTRLTGVAALAATLILAGCAPEASPAPSVTGGTNATEDLTIDECPPGSGRLTSGGALRNSTDDAADFVVRVSWLDADGTVVASGWKAIDAVDAGDEVDWSVSADLGEEAASSCTVVLTRGSL